MYAAFQNMRLNEAVLNSYTEDEEGKILRQTNQSCHVRSVSWNYGFFYPKLVRIAIQDIL